MRRVFDEISNGAEGGSRTRTSLRTTDFKSAASAIPPPRHVVRNSNSTKGFRFRLIINTVTLITWCVEDAGLLFQFLRQDQPPIAPIKDSGPARNSPVKLIRATKFPP